MPLERDLQQLVDRLAAKLAEPPKPTVREAVLRLAAAVEQLAEALEKERAK